LEAEVAALREQARIYAGALGESATSIEDPDNPKLVPEIARPLLYRLTEPSPDAQARLYGPDGTIVADSRTREGAGSPAGADLLLPAPENGPFISAIARLYDKVMTLLPHDTRPPLHVDMTPGAAGIEWKPDVREEVRLDSAGRSREMPPYIRRTTDNRLLVTVAEPIERDRHTVGIILLTREAREVDHSLFTIRMSIIALFGLALALTVLLSWYLSLTIARRGGHARGQGPHRHRAGIAAYAARRGGRAGDDAVGIVAGAMDADGRHRAIRRGRRP